jgi:hypothetical protein
MDITGEGFKERSPAMLFNSDRGNGTDSGTTWELLFTEGVYFKTEGGDNEDENPERVNGIQPDGIRDFSWIQTQTAIDHTHTLTAEKENQIDVSGNTSGTNDSHYHTLEEAVNGSTGSDSHNHEGTISLSPSRIVVSALSTTSRGVGPVIAPTNGEWVYGNWEYGFPGDPPPDTNEWDYEVDTPPEIYGEWVPYGTLCALDVWNDPSCTNHPEGLRLYRSSKFFLNDGDWVRYYWRCEGRWMDGVDNPQGTDWWFVHNVYIGSYERIRTNYPYYDEYRLVESGSHINVETRSSWTVGTYKRRAKTLVPGDNGSGSVNAVSSVNTSYTSFSVSTSGVSLGGDGSHSHMISIPTSGSSNENGHTHTVLASGIADINVSGSTESGGAHSHTFDFMYNELKDISNQNTRIASETTVKNRKMRIWRRTA